MPTYQYACTACDERLEAVQSFSAAPLTQCPACGGRLRKVFSAVGVVFKGSGFYKNDSRSSAKANGSSDGAGSGDKASSGAAASTSSDSSSGSTASGSSSGSSTSSSGGGSSAAPAAAGSKTA